MTPALSGAVSGAVGGGALLGAFHLTGMIRDLGAAAVLLGAVAAFWPMLAIDAGATGAALVHGVLFAAFLGLAAWGDRAAARVLGFGLIAHAAVDLGTMALDGPGPDWWAPFCATFDVVVGTGWLVVHGGCRT